MKFPESIKWSSPVWMYIQQVFKNMKYFVQAVNYGTWRQIFAGKSETKATAYVNDFGSVYLLREFDGNGPLKSILNCCNGTVAFISCPLNCAYQSLMSSWIPWQLAVIWRIAIIRIWNRVSWHKRTIQGWQRFPCIDLRLLRSMCAQILNASATLFSLQWQYILSYLKEDNSNHQRSMFSFVILLEWIWLNMNATNCWSVLSRKFFPI